MNERNFGPPFERPDTHAVVGYEPEDAVVIGLCGVRAEPGDSLAPVGLLRGVGVCDLGKAADDGLCRQSEFITDIAVQQVLQVVGADKWQSRIPPRPGPPAGGPGEASSIGRADKIARGRRPSA